VQTDEAQVLQVKIYSQCCPRQLPQSPGLNVHRYSLKVFVTNFIEISFVNLQLFAELGAQPIFFFYEFSVGWLSGDHDQFSTVFLENTLIALALKIQRAWYLRIFN
jgi:hypothetical protein